MGSTPPQIRWMCVHDSSVGAARRAAKALAESIGFDPTACEEIALAVTELATNLIKHASGGTLTLTPLADGGRVGLEIESRDTGPGIADVEQALGDRFSTAGTRGTGLGAVNRLMDELDIASRAGPRHAHRLPQMGARADDQHPALPARLWCGDPPAACQARTMATPL